MHLTAPPVIPASSGVTDPPPISPDNSGVCWRGRAPPPIRTLWPFRLRPRIVQSIPQAISRAIHRAAGGMFANIAKIHPAFAGIPILANQANPTNSDPVPKVQSTDDPALITFTSGSTGTPKGISRSIGFLLLQHRLLEKMRRTSQAHVDLISLPIFVLSNLAEGALSVFPSGKITRPDKLNGDKLAAQIKRFGVNRVGGRWTANKSAIHQRAKFP